MSSTEVKPQIQPFTVDVPQSQIDDLDRLAGHLDRRDRGVGDSYGVPNARVRELAEHWRTSFDWRALEARINAYPQFTTEIDGRTSTSSTSGPRARTRLPLHPHPRLARARPRVPRRHRARYRPDRARLPPRHPVDPGLRVLRADRPSAGWDNAGSPGPGWS